MSDAIISPADQQPEPKRKHWASVGVLFVALGVIIFFCAFGYGYFQLAKINMTAVKQLDKLQRIAVENRNEIEQLKQTLTGLQQNAQKSQALAARQEQIIADWQTAEKGNLTKWHIAEAQYLVSLANDQIQYPRDLNSALALLTRADQLLQKVNDPNLLEIRKSLTADIASLKAVQPVDITSLYLQLMQLNDQLDQLPLPASPLNQASTQASSTPAQSNEPWWKRGWHSGLEALRQIVIVRYNGTNNALPLIMPEEKAFLYQNLHAQIESAMWGVLHRNNDVYQASLTRALAWAQRYFVQDAVFTQTVLKQIHSLQAINLAPQAANLSETMRLFDHYFAQAEPSQSQQ